MSETYTSEQVSNAVFAMECLSFLFGVLLVLAIEWLVDWRGDSSKKDLENRVEAIENHLHEKFGERP